MAVQFVVEDGTGLTDATAYISVDDFKQYWDNFGYDYSALDDSDISVLINKSTRVLDGRYLMMWPGARKVDDQSLAWPRLYADYVDGVDIDSDSVPPEIENAVCEFAYASASGTDIAPVIPPTGIILQEKYKVEGAVEEFKVYDKYSLNASGIDRVTTVTNALRRILGDNLNPYTAKIRRI